MKILNSVIVSLFAAVSICAQPNPATFINGNIGIRYDTRTQMDGDAVKVGVTDKYTLNLNISNSAIFRGSIEAKPVIKGSLYGIKQQGTLTYAIDCDVVNPKNPAQTKNIGKLYGVVPVNEKNVYDFEHGNLKMSILGIGQATGFDSGFKGLAYGKPPVVKDGLFSKIKKEAMNIGRTVNGKTVTLVVNNYDIMQFQNHVLAAGPVAIYTEVTVNGQVVYDYARSAWYLKDITAEYSQGNVRLRDRLSGNIRWVESPDRKTSGVGEYQFDIRINEPISNEVAAFDNSKADESAFFAEDNSVPGLQGNMKYKDIIVGGETVTASQVQVNLHSNNLSKQQTMYICKLFLLSSIVPLNAE